MRIRFHANALSLNSPVQWSPARHCCNINGDGDEGQRKRHYLIVHRRDEELIESSEMNGFT